MKGNLPLTPMSPKKKLTQTEFYTLYLQSLDDISYRPTIANETYFYLAKLLVDLHFSLDLSGLILRNLNFTRTDFTGINLHKTDFSGSNCSYADFRGVTDFEIIRDRNTQFYGAKLTADQLISIQLIHDTEQSPVFTALNFEML